MRLYAEAPARMGQAISDCLASVVSEVRPVHRLNEEILEVEVLEQRRIKLRLRKNELELAAFPLNEIGPRLGTDTNPVQACRGDLRSVGLDCHGEPSSVESFDRGFVELQQRLASGAHDKALAIIGCRPSRSNGRRKRLGVGELPAVRPNSDKVSVAEVADRGGAVRFASCPEIAPAETTKDRRSAGVGAFALECVENLFDGVHALKSVIVMAETGQRTCGTPATASTLIIRICG